MRVSKYDSPGSIIECIHMSIWQDEWVWVPKWWNKMDKCIWWFKTKSYSFIPAFRKRQAIINKTNLEWTKMTQYPSSSHQHAYFPIYLKQQNTFYKIIKKTYPSFIHHSPLVKVKCLVNLPELIKIKLTSPHICLQRASNHQKKAQPQPERASLCRKIIFFNVA